MIRRGLIPQEMRLEDFDTIVPLPACRPVDAVGGAPRWTFFRQWLRNPLRMSSITPSGRQLARMMATAVADPSQGVVELGAGTGVITRALIERGVDPRHLLVVEMNEILHRLLQDSFPRARVAHGDARKLVELIAQQGLPGGKPVAAVVSSLGLLAMPVAVQRDILAAAFSVLQPGGVFVQYTYGPARPVSPEVAAELGLRCRRQGWAWRNLPPARVFSYSRD